MSEAIDKSTAGTTAPRTADQIEADIAAARSRLAGTLDDLQDRVRPENIAKRGLAKAKGVYVSPEGGVRVERVAATAVAVVGALLLRRGLRAYSNRRALAKMPDVMWLPVPSAQVPSSLQRSARRSA